MKTIYICYCRRDAYWKQMLENHLQTLLREPAQLFFSNPPKESGENPQPGVSPAPIPPEPDIVIILLSSRFLAQKHLPGREIPMLRQWLEGKQVIRTFTILLDFVGSSDNPLAGLPSISCNRRPLSKFPKTEADIKLKKITEELLAENEESNRIPRFHTLPPLIILYPDAEKKWLDFLIPHLRTTAPKAEMNCWSDLSLRNGPEWREELLKQLRCASVILLIAAGEFAETPFMRDGEIFSTLRTSLKAGGRVMVLSVHPLSAAQWSRLHDFARFPEQGHSLSEMKKKQRTERLAELALHLTESLPDSCREDTTISNAAPVRLLTPLPHLALPPVGRLDELTKIRALLEKNGKIHRALVVCGPAGSGKSELCRLFFRENYHSYSAAAWIEWRGSLRESFNAALADPTGQGIDIPPETPPNDLFRSIIRELTRLGPTILLVVNNMETTDDPDVDQLGRLPGDVLISCRAPLEGFPHYPLPSLSEADRRLLYYRHCPDFVDDESVDAIGLLCEGRAFTLSLLARTAWSAGLPPRRLLELLRGHGFNLNSAVPEPIERLFPRERGRMRFFEQMAALFDMNVLTIQERAVLTSLAILPPETRYDETAAWLNLKIAAPIQSLIQRGWLQRQGLRLLTPAWLQEIIRFQSPPRESKCRTLIYSLVNRLNPQTFLKDVDMADLERWTTCADFVVRHLDQPGKGAALLARRVAMMYSFMGRPHRALKFEQMAWELIDMIYPDEDHPARLASLEHFSVIFLELGDAAQALNYRLRGLKLRERAGSEPDVEWAAACAHAALLCREAGDNEQARRHLDKALAIAEQTTTPPNPAQATCHACISEALRASGEPHKALTFIEQALTIQLQLNPPDHPALAPLYHNRALLLHETGDPNGAVNEQQKALNIYLRGFANAPLFRAAAMNNLAMFRVASREPAVARQHLSDALLILENELPENHPWFAAAYANQAAVLPHTPEPADLEQSLQLLRDAIRLREQSAPRLHPDLAIMRHNAAAILLALQRPDEAAAWIDSALHELQQLFPPGHPLIQKARITREAICANLP